MLVCAGSHKIQKAVYVVALLGRTSKSWETLVKKCVGSTVHFDIPVTKRFSLSPCPSCLSPAYLVSIITDYGIHREKPFVMELSTSSHRAPSVGCLVILLARSHKTQWQHSVFIYSTSSVILDIIHTWIYLASAYLCLTTFDRYPTCHAVIFMSKEKSGRKNQRPCRGDVNLSRIVAEIMTCCVVVM